MPDFLIYNIKNTKSKHNIRFSKSQKMTLPLAKSAGVKRALPLTKSAAHYSINNIYSIVYFNCLFQLSECGTHCNNFF